MITHLLFKGLNSFNIGSCMFRKILAVIVAVLIFALVFLAVKFTKVEVPNFNRNLIMLAVVDISAFGLVMWKFGCPMEKSEEEKEKVESVKEVEVEAVEKESKDEVAGKGDSDKTKEEGADMKEEEIRNVEEDADEEAGDDVEEVKEE